MKIIIPSALLIPKELQTLGKIPAIIYPVEGKMTFQYLHRLYSGHYTEMIILCSEGADQVHDCLGSYKDVVIKDIPESELRDLGYTIYCAIQEEEEPIVINFGDTIVEDNIVFEQTDSYFYSEETLSDKWTFFEECNGEIIDIWDKTKSDASTKGRLFVGVFLIFDTVLFRRCLEDALLATDGEQDSFYYALHEYSKEHPMRPVYTQRWYDIGHLDKYYHSKLEVSAREFNYISIDSNRGILKKTSKSVDKFIGEIKWYLKLPSDIEYIRPRIFSYSTDYEKPYISMEYYAYHTVHELFLYGDLTVQQWVNIFERIKFVIDDFKRYSVSGKGISSSLEDVYIQKTLQRLGYLSKNQKFTQFFENSIIVNGKKFKSINMIMQLLEKYIRLYLLDLETFSIIHGDLCFTNILVDSNLSFIKVVDPRGSFGTFDIFGDQRYEFAKLFHSIDGKYDYIIEDLFQLSYDTAKTEISFSISERNMGFNLFNVFLDVFGDELRDKVKEVELIEGLLFLSMIPLHNESFDQQLVMLGTGLEILDRLFDIRE